MTSEERKKQVKMTCLKCGSQEIGARWFAPADHRRTGPGRRLADIDRLGAANREEGLLAQVSYLQHALREAADAMQRAADRSRKALGEVERGK